MTPRQNRQTPAPDGFTLVEIVLALLVVSIGLLAVLGLMGGGLDLSSTAVEDGQASMYARMVFEGYRAEFARDTNAWAAANTVLLPAFGGGTWTDTGTPPYDLAPIANGGVHTVIFEDSGTGIEEFSLRYRLSFANVSANLQSATLEVWPRRFGPAIAADAIIFYTEYYRYE